jgi:hypothetical protein
LGESRRGKEVEMKIMPGSRALLLMSLGVGAAMSAHAQGPFTLTCDATRSGTITIQLTGFTVEATHSGGSAITGKELEQSESKFAMTVQTDSGKDYDTLVSLMDGAEVLRSCKLIDGEGGGTAGKDDWTQMAVTKGKNKNKVNTPPTTASGALEWILTNADVTSVTVTGGANATGTPTTTIQATIEAQKYTFTM